jgi:hypothetical protein
MYYEIAGKALGYEEQEEAAGRRQRYGGYAR